ncbi:MAG: methyltransferase domain-containing protein [Gaiellaceae bacterium]
MSRRTDKKAASCEYFDRRAPTYETGRRWQRLREPQAKAVAMLDLNPNDRLLDVGCGTGAAVRHAAQLVTRAVGVDLSPKMIEQARELAEGFANVEFRIGDSEHLPFLDGEFSAVLCTSSLHHYPNPERAVKEIARVLASGGRLALGDINRDGRFMRAIDYLGRRFEPGHVGMRSSADFGRYLDEACLTPVASHRLWRGHFLIVLARK